MTAEEKPKKIFVQNYTQINNVQLNQMKNSIHNKVYDMSFLFEGKRGDCKKLTISKNIKIKSKSP